MCKQKLKKIIEALLFSYDRPIALDKLREIIAVEKDFKPRFIKEVIAQLKEEYLAEERAFQLEEIAEGYILRTKEEFRPYLEQLHSSRRHEKLSQAASEILAIIAFRQPVTRATIDAIRGVDSSGALHSLLERGLIDTAGKLETAGRPTLYTTTPRFLEHFGLRDAAEIGLLFKRTI